MGDPGNCYLLNGNEYIHFNGVFIMGCFLLGTIIIGMLLMSSNGIYNDISVTPNVSNKFQNNRDYLSCKLIAQITYNSTTNQPKTYLSFPLDHPGYLNLENQIRLVEIIRNSPLATEYKFGSSLGKFYIKKSYRHPITSPAIVGLVMSVENGYN